MTPLDARLMNMAELVCNADGSPRVGVLGYPGQAIVTTTATMNVAIAAAEFVTSKGKADGASVFTNDGSVNVAIAAAPASNSRIDVVWVKHNDDTTGDANALPVFGVTAGVAAASPTKPAIPTGATELATLRVYSGTTATNGGANLLTNTFQHTSMRGGVVYFRTIADMQAWTTAQIGQWVVVTDGTTATNYQWSGLTWVIQGGGLVLVGRLAFTASGTPTLDGVFSSLFANYLMRVNVRSVSAGTGIAFQLRAGGVNATGGSDYYAVSRTNSGASITGLGLAASSGPLTKGTIAQLYAEARIFDPNRAERTAFLVDSHGVGGASAAEMGTLGIQHNLTTAYDGIRLLTGGATLTGEMSIYGLA